MTRVRNLTQLIRVVSLTVALNSSATVLADVTGQTDVREHAHCDSERLQSLSAFYGDGWFAFLFRRKPLQYGTVWAVVAVAVPHQIFQGAFDLLQFDDAFIYFTQVTMRQLLHAATGASLVLPKTDQIFDDLDGEAQVAGLFDEAQGMHVFVVVHAVT